MVTPTPEPEDRDAKLAALARDPRFQQFMKRRARFGWILTAVMLVIYFGYILLIAFRRDLLAQPIGNGVTSVGIPLGLGVILVGIVVTGVYVRVANRSFDPELAALRVEHGL